MMRVCRWAFGCVEIEDRFDKLNYCRGAEGVACLCDGAKPYIEIVVKYGKRIGIFHVNLGLHVKVQIANFLAIVDLKQRFIN